MQIQVILNISALAYIISGVLVPMIKQRFKIRGRIKPFDCCSCLSFWFAIVLGFCFSPEIAIFAPLAFIIGAILDKYV